MQLRRQPVALRYCVEAELQKLVENVIAPDETETVGVSITDHDEAK
jgi:hypothetical protein